MVALGCIGGFLLGAFVMAMIFGLCSVSGAADTKSGLQEWQRGGRQ